MSNDKFHPDFINGPEKVDYYLSAATLVAVAMTLALFVVPVVSILLTPLSVVFYVRANEERARYRDWCQRWNRKRYYF